jgi:glycosyltransferase involved in cell wall biosynthesis
MNENHKNSLCILTTVSGSIKAFYQGQLEALNTAGLRTTVVTIEDADLRSILPAETDFFPVGFTRVMNPLRDLKVLWQLYKIFRKHKFDFVQYSTPKASLLGAIAAFVARIPIRVYILWGLYYSTQRGLKRFVLKMLEKLTCRLSTDIVPIAHEMVDAVESEGLDKKSKCEVMLNGSACGVDLQKFDPEKWPNSRSRIRNKYRISEEGIVIGVVARLTGEKGINELVSTFAEIAEEISNVYLLILGGQEEKDKLRPDTEGILETHPRIRAVGWQENPIPYYMAMDIFCLPTYREGFGKVNLEAQAMMLPVVSTNVIGPRESVDHGQTGFLVEPKNSKALVESLKKLVLDSELRKNMGRNGRKRIEQMFDSKDVIRAIVKHRLKLLSKLQ